VISWDFGNWVSFIFLFQLEQLASVIFSACCISFGGSQFSEINLKFLFTEESYSSRS
jgi:hypothetical protein